MSSSTPYREKWVSDCGTVTLYLGDCLEILPTLEPGSVDAVVTDPPYGIGFCHNGGKTRGIASRTKFAGERIAGDESPFDPRPFLQFHECILWGANHYSEKLPSESRWLTWDKRDGMKGNDQADCEHAWTNLGGPARLFSHKWNGMIRDGGESKTPRVHPMQKPVALLEWCVSMTTGTTIADFYTGSGTTGVACVRLGRRFIGIELEPRYFAIAKRRIMDELRRVKFLEPAPKQTQRSLID